jgi:hypothetical protein
MDASSCRSPHPYAISEDGQTVALKLMDAAGAETSVRFEIAALGP